MKSLLILCLGLMARTNGEPGTLTVSRVSVDLTAALEPITEQLKAQGDMLEKLRQENTAMKEKLACLMGDGRLNCSCDSEPRHVAFTVALGQKDSTGGYQKSIVFPKVITNVGQAYHNSTGVFQAPFKGVYYFRFTVTDILNDRYMGIQLYKNDEQILWLSEYDDDDKRTYISSGVALELEAGDKVNLRIPGGMHRLFDDYNNHCIFSGFLLFPQ